MEKVYIGVDIGKDGAISVIMPDGSIEFHTIPKIGTNVDDIALFNVFRKYSGYKMTIMLEAVHSIYGTSAKSNFEFGSIYGKKKMIGAVCGFMFGSMLDSVTPKKWQAEIWTANDKVFKSGKRVHPKKTSLLAAKRLFPQETFLATSRSRVPHDGIVDATLIALYCKLKYASI